MAGLLKKRTFRLDPSPYLLSPFVLGSAFEGQHCDFSASSAVRALSRFPDEMAARRSLQQDAHPCLERRHGASPQGSQSEADMRSTTAPALSISLALR